MHLQWKRLGDGLLAELSDAKDCVVIVAPFIKVATFRKICSCIRNDLPVICYTRWRIEEISQGVSDTEIWELIRARGNSKLFLINNLHAKYYRADSVVFIGSANLTMLGLGWAPSSNLELLVKREMETREYFSFEAQLRTEALEVDEGVYLKTRDAVERYISSFGPKVNALVLESMGLEKTEEFCLSHAAEMEGASYWLPLTRSPEIMFSVYSNETSGVSSDVVYGALHDLARLDIAPGLSEPQFVQVVRARLQIENVVLQIDGFLSVPRRFGEMSEFLGAYSSEGSRAWQTLMRWLLYFLGDRYSMAVANYSEIFRRN